MRTSIDFPKSLHSRLRMAAFEAGETLSELVVRFCEKGFDRGAGKGGNGAFVGSDEDMRRLMQDQGEPVSYDGVAGTPRVAGPHEPGESGLTPDPAPSPDDPWCARKRCRLTGMMGQHRESAHGG